MKRVAFPLLGLIFTTIFFLPIVRAEEPPQPGVTMTVYSGFTAQAFHPWETPPDWEPCYVAVVPNIDFDWGGGVVSDGCPRDQFMVHFSGWLTVPESGQWEFLNWSDDGWYMTLDGVVTIDDWNFHGCGGHWSGPNEGYSQLVAAQSYALDVWMFEWGGGACARLDYGSPSGYGTVPPAWLTTSPLPIPEPSPSVEPSTEATPSPTPTEEPTIDPSPTESPTPDPTATPEPTPEPSPSVEPTPIATPEPTPSATPTTRPGPSEVVSPSPTATPTPTPPPTPSPSPIESSSPDPSPAASPSMEPTPTPTETPQPPANAVEAVSQAVDAATKAVAEAVGAAVSKITKLGQDLSPAQKAKARPVAVALVISQIASAAAAAATNIRKAK